MHAAHVPPGLRQTQARHVLPTVNWAENVLTPPDEAQRMETLDLLPRLTLPQTVEVEAASRPIPRSYLYPLVDDDQTIVLFCDNG
jgi:hypothetical protein